jgi:GH35 family endo-1,4-beta-xylanase
MKTLEITPSLRTRIDTNIERHRKTDVTVALRDSRGRPVRDTTVEIRQREHEFLFGSNIFVLGQLGSPEREELYRAAIRKVFNQATLPFYWEGTEPEEGRHRFDEGAPYVSRRPPVERLIRFCREANLTMKGHAIVYHLFLPDWVTREPAKIPDLLLKRMDELSERFADRIPLWDAVNESNKTAGNPFQEAFGGKDYVKWSFDEIRKRFPKNQLLLNETSWISHSCLFVKGRYYHQARRLLDQGAPLDCVGFQWHLRNDFGDFLAGDHMVDDFQKLYDYYELFGDLSVPTAITEITIPSGKEAGGSRESQAAVVEDLYRIWFSIPSMNRITYWNLGDGLAHGPENALKGGLLDESLEPKPAYHALDRLINHEWKTDLTATTDKDGRVRFRGYFGTYDVSATEDAKSSASLRVEKGNRDEITLTLS